MSFHEFHSDSEATESGYPFRCSYGMYIGAAYCPLCREAAEDFDCYVYRQVVNAATGEVIWESPALAKEAAREAAMAAKPLTYNPFAGAF